MLLVRLNDMYRIVPISGTLNFLKLAITQTKSRFLYLVKHYILITLDFDVPQFRGSKKRNSTAGTCKFFSGTGITWTNHFLSVDRGGVFAGSCGSWIKLEETWI